VEFRSSRILVLPDGKAAIDDTIMRAGKLRQLDHRPFSVPTALRPYGGAELRSMRISAEREKRVQAL